jgi:hemolysin D
MWKHLKVLFSAWSEESKRRRREAKRKRIETAFLPAALEIMDTPPKPLGRITLWLIIAAAFFAIGWASFSKVDVVAVAEGRIAPRGKLQSVEASEAGVVTALLVREGDKVAKGEPLIRLDPTYADADADAARNELATARLQRARSLALLDYVDGKSDYTALVEEAPEGLQAAELRLITSRISQYENRAAGIIARRQAAEQARAQARTEMNRINETLPLLMQQFTARRDLAKDGYASRLSVVELEERITTLKYALKTQELEEKKSYAEIRTLEREAAQHEQEFRVAAAAELSEAEAIIATRTEILEKAERRSALQTLTAPVSGTVNEVSLTTIGELAEPGQPLITLVPEGDELIVESFLLNKDVGFIHQEQDVVVKLEAYPFTRFGMLKGKVETISADAIVDQQRGLVYPARIRITGNEVRVPIAGEVREATLSPGMAATVEIKTGKRRVISFILSPIAKAVREAGRER